MSTFVLTVIAALVSLASGSIVTFDKSPDVIQTILTKQMTLACSVVDSATSPSASLVGRRSVTNTSDNVMYVTSMVVLRNGQEVATITPFSPATGMKDLDKINVTGSVSGHQGERGHLRLTWSYPDELQSGNYTCEVNGIGSTGHSVTTSTSLVMAVRNPTLSDLVKHVHDQEVTIAEHTTKNKALEQQLNNLTNSFADQLKKEMAHMKNELMSQMMGLINESRHFEKGHIVCGGSRTVGWSSGIKEVTVNFTSPYKTAPIVHISPVNFDYYASQQYSSYTDFNIELVNVTESDFSLRCKTKYPSNSNYYIRQLDIDWISLP